MTSPQPGILDDVPAHARFLTFGLLPGADAKALLKRVATLPLGAASSLVVGLGLPLVAATERSIPGLRTFPALSGPGTTFPSTQGALWAVLRGQDAGETLLRGRALLAALGEGVHLDEDIHAFRYNVGRDLGGYEDGTENPKDEDAVTAAITQGQGPGIDGSSFVAAQRWIHDLTSFARLTQDERDQIIGRRLEDNEEIEDAPVSAHVKRSAQESFEPEAFMLRRSMPWGNVAEQGLYFVAYGSSLDAFERVLRRMAGLDDGVADALLRLSRPVSGGYYWCPPVRGEALDLTALGV